MKSFTKVYRARSRPNGKENICLPLTRAIRRELFTEMLLGKTHERGMQGAPRMPIERRCVERCDGGDSRVEVEMRKGLLRVSREIEHGRLEARQDAI